MVRNCKRNSKLEMLNEEYERMHLVDERKIEMKMRKIRLTKLEKEIEQIKRYNSFPVNSKDLSKTKEEKRMETIKKAREMGQYFSQLNMKKAAAEPKMNMNSQTSKKGIEGVELLRSKRKKYDNEIRFCGTQNHRLREPRKKLDTNENINFQTDGGTHYGVGQPQKIFNTNSSTNNNKEEKTMPMKENLITQPKELIDFQMAKNGDGAPIVVALGENVQFIDLGAIDSDHSGNYDRGDDFILPYK